MVRRLLATLALIGALAPEARALEQHRAGAPTPATSPTGFVPPPSALKPDGDRTGPAPQAARPLSTASQPGASPRRNKPEPPPTPVALPPDPRPTYGPDTFALALSAAERYRAIVDAGGWPLVPNEATRLKPGEGGPAATALRRRLAASGDLAEADAAAATAGLDETLGAALRRFQLRHGLEPTGTVGPLTLSALNVPAATRLRELQGSAQRLMGSKFPFGERYLAVNIPSATVEAVERGQVARRFVAVVGKPDRPSPTVETRATAVNFNPTWTVPTSLIRKDIIPHVRKDPLYLAKMKIRLFDGTGQEVDPGTIDWTTEKAASFTVRQDAGVENSLGEIRIDMPNRHAVYMHDTPSKRLFARSMRARSSGCVRISGVKELAGWLLDGTAGPAGPGSTWGAAEIDSAIAAGKRADARLARPVPVAWVYMTGWATPDGTVHFRDDVYGLDKPPPPAAAPASGPGPLTLDALVTSSIRPVR